MGSLRVNRKFEVGSSVEEDLREGPKGQVHSEVERTGEVLTGNEKSTLFHFKL